MISHGVLYVTITLLCYEAVNAAPRKESSLEDLFTNNEIQDRNSLDADMKARIIGGGRANVKDYPYTASVIVQTAHEGSAVILNKRWLLTTAWVVLYEEPKSILVRAGSNSAILGGQTSWVEKIVIHPNYTQDWPYDLALIKLKKPFKFNQNVKPIKIADSTPSDKVAASLTGFGFTNTTMQYSYKHDGWLRQSNSGFISYGKCQKYYSGNPAFTEQSFCTAVTESSGPCWFDYGSPVVYRKKLVGVFSGTPSCVDPNFPAVHTDVTKQKSWIEETIKHNSESGVDTEL